MVVTKIFKGITGSPPRQSAQVASDVNLRLEVLADFEEAGTGWLWATDAEGRLIYISQQATNKLECPIEERLAQPLATLFACDPQDSDNAGRSLNFRLTARSKIVDVPVRLTPGEAEVPGRSAWWSLSGQPKFDAAGTFLGYRGSANDITVEYERKLEASRLSEYDSLTGLANRHRMGRRLGAVLSSFKAAKRACALMMLDLDRFKAVNDTMGHPAGDDLLKQVAQRLRRVIGDRGEIGRLGGDEFQVILPDLDDRGKLGELAGKLIQMISQPYPIGDKQAIIGTSVGIAIAPYDGLEMEDLISHSDLALYAAKNGGRGQFRFYSADLKSEAEERRLVDEDLRAALQNDELELHYQPVVRAKDHVVIGFEALARWDHPERGAVGPDVFIPIAEESNLINELGEWALRRACTDAIQWPEEVRVAVNVSARQFTNPAFVGIVESVLQATGIAANRLELELTETIFMGDSEETDETFRALKALGVRLALDDFGTGYSSLSYLRSAPFDKIKVDRTFVDTCTDKDQNSAKIIAAIIGLSDALGMETTVEGVEAFDQHRVVCEKGARFIQGWIYSKALPQEQILENIAAQNFRIEPTGPERHRSERRSMFRRVGVIHEDHRYEALMRELSRTGASIEGLLGVPVGTGLVLDMGGGQLVVCTVMRSADGRMAVEFETPLVSDGAGGLCTRHRVSPYALAAAGMPLAALSEGQPFSVIGGGGPASKPQFLQVAVG